MKIRITEQQLRNVVRSTIMEMVNQDILTNTLDKLNIKYNVSPLSSLNEMKDSWYVDKLLEINLEPVSLIEIDGGFIISLNDGRYATGANFMTQDALSSIGYNLINQYNKNGEPYDYFSNIGMEIYEGYEETDDDDDGLIIFTLSQFNQYIKNIIS